MNESSEATGTGPGLVAGRYRTERAVGRGGMGTVWLATDERLGRRVALKQLGAFPGETDSETARAMREARHAASLNHPSVVQVYDVAEHAGRPWLVMEYVDGPTLAQAVRERGRLRPRGAADLGAQLAGALVAAHAAGIVHRDIKPANVLIGDRRPKLADFGTARAGADDQLTKTGLVTGTPTYMAPEVADGHEPSVASDLWALGATLYFAVEGRDAYASQGNPLATLRHIATTDPRRAEQAGPLGPVLARLMDRDPGRRGTAAQARADLERVAKGGESAVSEASPTAVAPTAVAVPVSAASQPPEPRPGPRVPVASSSRVPDRPRSRAWVVWLLCALALIAGAGVAIALLPDRDDGGSATTTTQSPSSTPTSSATTSESPTEPTPEETTTEPTPEETTTEPTPDARFPTDEVTPFVTSHFATVTDKPDQTWGSLTPAMQERAGGKKGYRSFWQSIESVSASNLEVDESTGAVTLTLEYTPKDKDPITERHRLQLVRDGDTFKIDSDSRL